MHPCYDEVSVNPLFRKDAHAMSNARCSAFLLVFLLLVSLASHAYAKELPMDDFSWGPPPARENYVAPNEYRDTSISVKIHTGRFAETAYHCTHVKISHPSQLRTAPAGLVDSDLADYHSFTSARARLLAEKVNAVVAVNGDYHTKPDKCQVILRMGRQFRNIADGTMDLLIIDNNGNLSALEHCNKDEYLRYYNTHQEQMYQVFCFGPVLCRDGLSVIGPEYRNAALISQTSTQRTAIAQIGPLEYLLITCEGPYTKGSKGMTLMEFAALCEKLGKEFSPKGCTLAFNLDGGNSASLIFKGTGSNGQFGYVKYNCPEIERYISDILYFATLEE